MSHTTSAAQITSRPACLLDFDNTLARLETVVDWAGSRIVLERMLRERGCPDDLFARVPKGNLPLYSALMNRLRDDSVSAAHAATLLRAGSESIERFEMAGVARAEPLDGARELLLGLARCQKPTAIVTSNSAKVVHRWLELQHLEDSVSLVVGRDSLLELKPSPAMLLRALEALGVGAPTARALMVGDSIADLEAARAAGIRFAAIARDQAAQNMMREAGVAQFHRSPAELIHYLVPDVSPSKGGGD